MSGNAWPFIGNFYTYFIVFANTFQIQTKYSIKYKYMPFCDFQIQIQKILYSNTNANTYLNPTLAISLHYTGTTENVSL